MTRVPEAARGAVLGNLLEKVVVRGEEEGEPLPELIDVETRVDCRLHVSDGVREGERHLLHRRRSGFTHVITADRDRVPLRQLAFAESEDVGDDPQRRPRRVDVGAARDVFLQDVVLDGARQRAKGHALALRDRHIQRQQDDGRRVDGHRR